MKISYFQPLFSVALLFGFAAMSFAQSGQSKSIIRATAIARQINAVMDAQAAAWNRGDVKGYMDGYERSEQTIFISGDRITHGWQTVLDHYLERYDSREKMGTLTFSEVQISPINAEWATVLGKWELTREKDHPHGYFTLIFRKVKAGWRIVQDHTSSAS